MGLRLSVLSGLVPLPAADANRDAVHRGQRDRRRHQSVHTSATVARGGNGSTLRRPERQREAAREGGAVDRRAVPALHAPSGGRAALTARSRTSITPVAWSWREGSCTSGGGERQ